ncbi:MULTISPECIES: peptide-methionine (S)-S-oxide reductase MsrA [Maribacter]|uniref:Peptide methionine sulfoxide reductase MsrA n=1 Tax=Maribacter flavus TaxID=1658664 RepID=A0ABU7IFV6_9FLAO|nr:MULTISPECIES: peptide-methionine (S)-S-oxide reductase MsrA [Maribacter]MDC6405366.1 peptide-methionine (S)-S-oxide reductase MsrA [Maribacter sp. PR66]MEE1971825.1 peptide-methionine (S)-S-oxide reductase MsrA [Maribacter flavus]
MGNIKLETITVGGGCFWCTEAIFQEIKGVQTVVLGYTGGNAPGKPTYREICSGLTGHAEVVRVTFNNSMITLYDILHIFMTTHDPTTLNRQGADVGTQYRSAIYYTNDNQKKIAEHVLADVSKLYENPIVTELTPMAIFYEAEEYHQDYYKNNPSQAYCQVVIDPKLAKLRKLHANKLN